MAGASGAWVTVTVTVTDGHASRVPGPSRNRDELLSRSLIRNAMARATVTITVTGLHSAGLVTPPPGSDSDRDSVPATVHGAAPGRRSESPSTGDWPGDGGRRRRRPRRQRPRLTHESGPSRVPGTVRVSDWDSV